MKQIREIDRERKRVIKSTYKMQKFTQMIIPLAEFHAGIKLEKLNVLFILRCPNLKQPMNSHDYQRGWSANSSTA